MTTDITTSADYGIMERVMVVGDLAKLTPSERVEYYLATCNSLQLNYLTRPFDYIILNGKMTLYAKKEASDQLRFNHQISITSLEAKMLDGVYVVRVIGSTPTGRTDVATGVVAVAGLKGNELSNACMKAETKAKRRLTLSICGLGMTDESEIDSIKNRKRVNVDPNTGEILDAECIEEPTKPTLAIEEKAYILNSDTIANDLLDVKSELELVKYYKSLDKNKLTDAVIQLFKQRKEQIIDAEIAMPKEKPLVKPLAPELQAWVEEMGATVTQERVGEKTSDKAIDKATEKSGDRFGENINV